MSYNTFAAGGRCDYSGSNADIINDGPLKPRNYKMHPFTYNFLFDSGQSVEYNGSLSSVDRVNTVGQDREPEAGRDGPSNYLVQERL